MEKNSPPEDMQSPESNVRRSVRKRIPSRRALENITENISVERVEYSDDEKFIVNSPEKPCVLAEEEDMNQKLYSFKTPKKKHGMNLLATNTPKTPKTPGSISHANQKTPHGIRTKIKKGKKIIP